MSKSKKQTSVTFAPLAESIYLARSPKPNSSLVLQAQRVDPYAPAPVEPVFDVKQNARPITRLLNKVRSLNMAVGSILPDPLYDENPSSSSSFSPSSPFSPQDTLVSSQSSPPGSPTAIVSPEELIFAKSGGSRPRRAHTISGSSQSSAPHFPCPMANSSSSSSPCANTTCSACTSKEPTFSIVDREASPKDPPIAVFNRFELAFAPKTVPLLSRFTRLDRGSGSSRMADDYTMLQLEQLFSGNNAVSWYMVPEEEKQRGNATQTSSLYRASTYKVYDKSTGMLVGKWKRRSALTPAGCGRSSSRALARKTTASSDESTVVGGGEFDDCTSNIKNGLEPPNFTRTAATRYFLNRRGSASRPFFSGEVYSLAAGSNGGNMNNINYNNSGGSSSSRAATAAALAAQDEEWCFLVNRGKAKGGWTVIASLKGYELRMVDSQDSPLRQFYLDEYLKHLRLKYINRMKKQQQQLQRQIAGGDDDEFYSSSDEVNGGLNKVSTVSGGLSPPTIPVKVCPNTLQTTKHLAGHSHTNQRVRVNDALSMVAIMLLLNLDHGIRCRMAQLEKEQNGSKQTQEQQSSRVLRKKSLRRDSPLNSESSLSSGEDDERNSKRKSRRRGSRGQRKDDREGQGLAGEQPSGAASSGKWYTKMIPHLFG